MFPFFEIAGVFIPTYNIALAIGILAGAIQLFFAARRKRVVLRFLADNFFILLLAALFCARLTEILLHNYAWLDFFSLGSKSGGFSFFGGSIGFLVTLGVLTRKFNENFFVWLDLILLTAAVTLVFHHLGTFLAGSAYGTQTMLPWGVTFTNPDAVGYSTIPIHPTQIYAAIFALGFFIAASFVFKNTTKAGKAGVFLLLTLSLTYFFLDFLRGDSAVVFGPLRASQYFTLFLAILAAALVVKMKHSAHEARSGELNIN
ncbi:prolipoprotein diacylglyceryl transferase [Candidatus Gracilibacteria bacterium]|nr:prolipoprotein diacylglyceryl transferase [Candidatus Gracilibacteria bacterium]MCF7856342.1 prolipoprotein diacylglyceryl transferase [Candidatus Gracilibacteria bacterium]MCF7896731.1 prolipoprotein diacylglyceryl transferase [Candidatus Gracilibacteria bacterium]